MRTEKENKLIEIVRAVAVDGVEYLGIGRMEEDELRELYAFARLHQLEHFIAYAMMPDDGRFERPFYNAAGFTMRQIAAATEIAGGLRRADIPFIILKGHVLRGMYLEKWMRNSCDVDILVHPEDMDRAGKVLEDLLYKREAGLSAHDVTYSYGKMHIELHYTLMEEHLREDVSSVLRRVWEESTPGEGSERIMSDEMFYFYHVAHIWKHFENGGCGVRSLLDLWVLNHRCKFDEGARRELLERGGLLKLDGEMRRLAEYWFAQGDGEGLDVLEEYVLSGGAYGRTENSVAVKKTKRGGRVKYFFSRVFAPRSLLEHYYPSLKKRPYLIPVYQVRRWIDAMRRDGKKYVNELRENIKQDENGEKIEQMLVSLGIKSTQSTTERQENENNC